MTLIAEPSSVRTKPVAIAPIAAARDPIRSLALDAYIARRNLGLLKSDPLLPYLDIYIERKFRGQPTTQADQLNAAAVLKVLHLTGKAAVTAIERLFETDKKQ